MKQPEKEREEEYVQKIKEIYMFFDDKNECANSAHKFFTETGWKWYHGEVPSLYEISSTLVELSTMATRMRSRYAATGGLIVFEGRFGHSTIYKDV